MGPFYALPAPPPAACPICAGPGARSIGQFYQDEYLEDLYFCLDCESATFPFSRPKVMPEDVVWHLKVRERNIGFAEELFRKIGIETPQILDIGCGIGTLIEAAKLRGGGGIGFELNEACVHYGKERGRDLRHQQWTAQMDVGQPNLITCIMVLEHIYQPRPLLEDLAKASLAFNAPVFISVPWFNKNHWPTMAQPVEDLPNHPFRCPGVHVTHFSMDGFKDVCRSFGMKDFQLIRGGWTGFLIQ